MIRDSKGRFRPALLTKPAILRHINGRHQNVRPTPPEAAPNPRLADHKHPELPLPKLPGQPADK